jgi:hypothetical protein
LAKCVKILALIAGMLFFIPNAKAQIRISGSVTGTTGYSDNIDSRSRNPPPPASPTEPGEAAAEADGFADITPMLHFYYGSSRFQQQLQASVALNLYFLHTEAISYSSRLEWIGMIQIAERLRMALNVHANQGRQSALTLTGGAASTVLAVQPSGNVESVEFGLTENLTWDVDARWSFSQSLVVGGFIPYKMEQPGGPTLDADIRFTGRRRWNSHDFGGDLSVNYFANLEFDDPNAVTTGGRHLSEHQLLLTLTGSWDYELAQFWSTGLSLGAIVALNAKDLQGLLHPTGNAALRWRRDNANVELTVGHDIRPNIFVGQLFIIESANLRGEYPLWRGLGVLSVSASGGYEYSTVLDLIGGEIGEAIHAINADVALNWRYTDNLTIALRYQFTSQAGDGTAATSTVPSFYRNAVMLSFTGTYPGERRPTRLRRRGGGRRGQDADWNELFQVTPGGMPQNSPPPGQ